MKRTVLSLALLVAPGISRADDVPIDCAKANELVSGNNTLQAFDEAVTLCPSSGALHYNRALLLEKSGRTEDALKALDKASAVDKRAIIRAAKGSILQKAGRFEEAESAYQEALRAEPGQKDAVRGLASLALQHKAGTNPPVALADSQNRDARFASAVQDRLAGRLQEAERALRVLVERDEEDWPAWRELGLTLKAGNRLDDAAAAFERVAKAMPADADLQNILGETYFHLGRMNQAEQSFSRAADLAPSSSSALRNLGLTRIQTKDFRGAASALRQALATGSEDASLHGALGWALLQMKDEKQAETHMRRAIELNGEDAALHNNLGVLLRGQGKTGEARKEFDRALQIDPAFALAKKNIEQLTEKKRAEAF